jgi:hypothetical protein
MLPLQRRSALPLVLGLLLCVSPPDLAAQSQVNRVDDVRFGNVVSGIAKTVLRTDASAAGRFNLVTPANRFFLVRFTLPTSMTGPGGVTLPLSFAGTTAGYSEIQAITSQVGFSPAVGTIQRSPDGQSSVYLGATVTPAAGQVAGSYSAPITLTLIVF